MQMISLRPIGVIRSPFNEPTGTPIQPRRNARTEATVEVFTEFARGLTDLDGFSHVILVYYFHLCSGFDLMVTPYLDTRPRGLFATRAPRRPNPIGLSVVQLNGVGGNVLRVLGVDIVDGTPLLDIKPYVPEFDAVQECRTGWLEDLADRAENRNANGRFHEDR
jgi:tRNA-Thr(GGU) m(6)t(6)A37 methyltransferase TsaA